MKKVINVTLGSSENDYQFETRFLGKDFTIQRLGANQDEGQAWELLRRMQAKADVIGLSMLRDHYDVGAHRFVQKKTRDLMKVVTRVPITSGTLLGYKLQVRAVRYVQKELINYFNNQRVLFLSGMLNYEMAQAMSEYTRNIRYADALMHDFKPKLLESLAELEDYAVKAHAHYSSKPEKMLEHLQQGTESSARAEKVADYIGKAHVIVGTVPLLQRFGNVANLEGKTVITSLVDKEREEFFKACKVNLVVDVSPMLFERSVAVSTIEAMILAALEIPAEELSGEDVDEILDELQVKPRLLHPTGKFRNIKRFAFVVHPLSRESLRMGVPILKSTPDFIMGAIEKAVAHKPPTVFTKMENIVSPTGAEAEGWLISVGGTPKEMLAHSPEFTYQKLLEAAKLAEKMGAQVMGLGAFTKVVGDAGVTVARRADIPITTGNSYSASGALWAANDAMKRMGMVPIPKDGKKLQAKTMVIGASGSIGSVSARLLAMAFDEVYLAGRTMSSLEALKESILKETPDAKVIATIDYEQYLGEMDMIVTSTSGAGKKILDIMKVKPGCVITDVARPLDLPASEVAKRNDVLVIESGEIELPSKVVMEKSIGLPKGIIYACLAETIVLALEGRFEVFTIGRDTEWEKVKEIYKLGLKHGMKLAAISGVNGVYSDEDIARVVKNAKEALKTWKVPANS
jgi:predicted amino acid dehydrogenase